MLIGLINNNKHIDINDNNDSDNDNITNNSNNKSQLLRKGERKRHTLSEIKQVNLQTNH